MSHSNEATPGSGVFCGSVATARHSVTYQLQEKVFSVGSVPRLYHEDQWDKPFSL
jgi:hypothetical protein